MCLKREPFHMLLPLLSHVVPLKRRESSPHNTRGQGTLCSWAPHAFNIDVFKYGKSNPTTIKHIYNESENLNENCDVPVPMIGMESMMTRAGHCYTRDYLTPGICSLIKPAAKEKLMWFHAKLHTVMLY